jgi:hypothetical protein
MAAERGGAEPVANEDDERQQHEDGAQPDHAGERMRVIGADKLRQEGQKEDRQLRIQDVDQRESVTIDPSAPPMTPVSRTSLRSMG